MKKLLFPLLLLVLVLAGCNSESSQTTGQTTTATQPPIAYLRVPDSTIEELAQGAVTAYSLEGRSVTGMGFFADRLLAFTTADHVELTTVLVLGGQELGILQSATMDCALSAEHLTVSADGQTFAYYHNMENTIVLLNSDFSELRRIQLPDQITERPLLNADLSLLYYTNGPKIYALELETGLSRLLKEHSCLSQRLTGLHFDGSLLEVMMTLEDGQTQVAFISTENGETVGTDKELLSFSGDSDRFFLRRKDGIVTETLVGTIDGTAQAMESPSNETLYPAFSMDAIIGVQGSSVTLYDLASGRVRARIDLGRDVLVLEADAAPAGDFLWLRVLDDQSGAPLLLQWDPAQSALRDDTSLFHKRYTAEDPDTEGLAACQEQADSLFKELGITLSLSDPVPMPEGYSYVPEYQVRAISDSLSTLQTSLEALPAQFLQGLATVNQSGTVHITLVRDILDITGRSFTDEGGFHTVSAGDHHILLVVGNGLDKALYHHLSHVLDSFVYAHSSAYDTWNKLNPKAFAYAGTYEVKPDPEDPLLQGDTQRFVSAHGTSFAMEDRATLFAAAMDPDSGALLALPGMQEKLQTLCNAIRKAYDWEQTELTLPWEQHLKAE